MVASSDKQCPCCKKFMTPTAENFGKNRSTKDGLGVYCKPCNRKLSRENYYENHEERLEYRRKWREENHDHKLEIDRAWKKNHRDKVMVANRHYYFSHKKEHRQRTKHWEQNNKDRVRVIAQNRRSRKLNAQGSHTLDEIFDLYKIQGGLCFTCKKDLGSYYHEDHWIPLSKGGTNYISNIRLLCPMCNLSKKDKLPDEWTHRWYLDD